MPMPDDGGNAPASLIALPGADALAARLAQALGATACRLDHRRFPDGEAHLRVLDAVDGRQLLVVAALRQPDPQLPSLFFLADALRDLGAARVGLVAPYLPYLRQDRRFLSGEALTSHSFAAWISARFDGLVTVDPHLHRIRTLDEVYRIPAVAVSSAAAIAAWIGANVPRPHLFGPDEESEQWVRGVAQRIGCGHSVLRKTRLGDREVQIALPSLEGLEACTPVLVDDIVSTARTLAVAARALRSAGLAAPVCVGVHAVFGDDAGVLLQQAGVGRVVTCNTLPHASNAIDVTGALVEGVAAVRAQWAAGGRSGAAC